MASGIKDLVPVRVGTFWGGPVAPLDKEIVDYLVAAMKAADTESTFMENKPTKMATQWEEPDRIMRFMVDRGFGGIVFVKDGSIVGRVIGQEHGDAFHIFDIHVENEENRGKGVGTQMVSEVAYQLVPTGITWVRVSGGGHPASVKIRTRLLADRKNLPFLADKMPRGCADEAGWLKIKKPK